MGKSRLRSSILRLHCRLYWCGCAEFGNVSRQSSCDLRFTRRLLSTWLSCGMWHNEVCRILTDDSEELTAFIIGVINFTLVRIITVLNVRRHILTLEVCVSLMLFCFRSDSCEY